MRFVNLNKIRRNMILLYRFISVFQTVCVCQLYESSNESQWTKIERKKTFIFSGTIYVHYF